MMKRGQGAFEYILMLSGVLLIVILIIFILQGTLAGTGNQLNTQANSFGNTVKTDYVKPYTQNLVVVTKTGGVNGGLNGPHLVPDTQKNLVLSAATGGASGPSYPCCYNWDTVVQTAPCSNAGVKCVGTLVCPTVSGAARKFNTNTRLCAIAADITTITKLPCCLRNGAATSADGCGGATATSIGDCYALNGINCPSGQFNRKAGVCG
ncbi:MAG: class III signal peptide-containing protein [Candidatus Micrarchaeia archaeon]|jgi:hypothetical protein